MGSDALLSWAASWPLAAGLAVALALFTLTWLVHLLLRDASIVDVLWGPSFLIVAGVYAALAPGAAPRRWLVLALVAAWALRLGGYLFVRRLGEPEDARYRAMRARWGGAFPWVSLVVVFWLQAVIAWVVSWPLARAIRAAEPAGWSGLDGVGALLVLAGLLFETVGDWQLARFKADPANSGGVMDRGLWRISRHPNYFGECVVWWGFGLLALATGFAAWWTLASPLLMTFLLLRVSGVRLLEKGLAETKPGYADYVRRTNAFFPGPPRS